MDWVSFYYGGEVAKSTENTVMTLSEVAEYLRIAEKTVLRLVHAGTIPATKVGNQWRFLKPLIDDWMYASMGNGTQPGALGTEHPITESLSPDYILLDIKPGEKEYVLRQLIAPLVSNGIIRVAHPALKRLVYRESISTTGVGNGVAFPHVRNPKDNPSGAPPIVAGVCREGTDFGALDAKPVNLFFLLCSNQESIHLSVMSRLGHLLSSEVFRAALIRARSPAGFIELIQKREQKE